MKNPLKRPNSSEYKAADKALVLGQLEFAQKVFRDQKDRSRATAPIRKALKATIGALKKGQSGVPESQQLVQAVESVVGFKGQNVGPYGITDVMFYHSDTGEQNHKWALGLEGRLKHSASPSSIKLGNLKSPAKSKGRRIKGATLTQESLNKGKR